MKFSKKMIIIPIGILILSSVVVVSGGTVSSEKYATVSGAFSNTSNLTLEKAKEIAKKSVPSDSICFSTEENTYDYEFKFYNDKKKEEYKIEIDKTTGNINSYKIELYNDMGSSKVNLNDDKIKGIILKEIPKAEILSTELDNDDQLKKYTVKFQAGSYYGKFEINPETGIILEKEFKLKDKYENNYNTGNYISIDKIKEIVSKEIPNGVIIDIDIENYHSTAVYEIEVNNNSDKYELVLNAQTGEKISLKTDYDRKHNSVNKNEQKSTNNNVISVEEAKQIVLKKVPDGIIKKIKLDYDDGMATYEGKMYKGNYEYEFEINAYTGDIIDWEEEFDD